MFICDTGPRFGSIVKAMEDSVSTILREIKKIYCKLENFDDRIQTLECSQIYMDEKDLIGSSQVRTGLDPIRKDIFDLKTELKKFDLKCKNNFSEIKSGNEKTSKRLNKIHKEIQAVREVVREEKTEREEVVSEVTAQVRVRLG